MINPPRRWYAERGSLKVMNTMNIDRILETTRGLADADMLECQLALEEGKRNEERIRALRKSLG